ncbi:adenosylcobinamide-phosphate synthase CbiB [Anianabacter salinae]|uniref:adenosylcobinamide-phosphate synthase CbiB n=1 Tax=Anianabacter salinae TaxID=2851023 RepID=UPI00225DCD88|nr:adenosylcobinamide-phosphate synthase CbiB [Anianabacter salinae]MBV0910767.1 adenosylcobinamide-phosphate synthase CbiB [Anianabacter salinae]
MSMALVLALVLDAIAGEPRWLWSRVPHPAVVMGRAVGWCDRVLNTGSARRAKGIGAVVLLVLAAALTGAIIASLPLGWLWQTLAAAILLAQRSLVDHVRAVVDALRMSTTEGRQAVAMIVGRDTADMDDPAIARAAIESAAENLSDGVVAPAFWFLIGGLPAMLVYKVVNTADSMIGYRTPRHEAFGWAAARLDDVLNLVPARMTAALILLTHPGRGGWAITRRDAPLHRSPNAGWPEAAMAAALGVALSGPRSYHGQTRDYPWVNAGGRRDSGADDIEKAIGAMWRAWALLLAGAAIIAVV